VPGVQKRPVPRVPVAGLARAQKSRRKQAAMLKSLGVGALIAGRSYSATGMPGDIYFELS